MSNINFEEEQIITTPMFLYMDYINLRFNKFLKKYHPEVTPRDFTYLVSIKNNPNTSQKELSQLLFVSESNVTQIIKRLEKNGFVSREVSKENKSKKVLNLTQKGDNTVSSILKIITEWEGEFEENYNPGEIKLVKKVLYDYADKSIDYE